MKNSYVAGAIVAGVVIAWALSFIVISDIALFAGFIVAIGGIIYADRRKVKLEGIVFIRRTKRGRDFIDKIASSANGFWRAAGVVGIIIAIILMVGGSLLLLNQAYLVLSGAEGGVKLLLPGPVSAPVDAPGVFVVPWWIWVIGIAVVIIPHEFMHGIMCRIDKVRIKSVGWLLLVIIPGAFVEPDEKQLQKMKKITKLRVYAAGSFANMITAVIVLIIFAIFFALTVQPAGVFVGTVPGSPAYNASLNGSIISINNQSVVSNSDMSRILSQYNPGDSVDIKTAAMIGAAPSFLPGNVIPGAAAVIDENDIRNYRITLGSHPERDGAFLGVSPIATAITLSIPMAAYAGITTLLLWMFIFSFGIGLVNLLPIKPLDGGLMLEELVGGRKNVVRAISVFMLLVLIFNLVGPLFLGL